MFRNKRGGMAVVLVVILVLLTITITLISFAKSHDRINVKIAGTGILEQAYAKEEAVDFYIRETSERVLATTFKEIFENGDYLQQAIKKDNQYFIFSQLDSGLNEKFKEKFRENFKTEFAKYGFIDSKDLYFQRVASYISDGKFNTDFSDRKLSFDFTAPEIIEKKEEVEINYDYSVGFELTFEEINLESFEKIYEVKEECRQMENAVKTGECFASKLNNFEFEISDNENYYLVEMKSRKKFFADDTFERIEIRFFAEKI